VRRLVGRCLYAVRASAPNRAGQRIPETSVRDRGRLPRGALTVRSGHTIRTLLRRQIHRYSGQYYGVLIGIWRRYQNVRVASTTPLVADVGMVLRSLIFG